MIINKNYKVYLVNILLQLIFLSSSKTTKTLKNYCYMHGLIKIFIGSTVIEYISFVYETIKLNTR